MPIAWKFSLRKYSCVDDKTFVLLHVHRPYNFPVSCLKSVSQRDTAVSSQKRPKSVLDTDDPYHVACLATCSTSADSLRDSGLCVGRRRQSRCRATNRPKVARVNTA